MTDMDQPTIVYVGGNRQMKCPECGHLLPIDAVTECDTCGAHLHLYIDTVVPSTAAFES